jgi:hypothetical protein
MYFWIQLLYGDFRSSVCPFFYLLIRRFLIRRPLRLGLGQGGAGAGNQIGICCVFRWAATKLPFSQGINQLRAQGAEGVSH